MKQVIAKGLSTVVQLMARISVNASSEWRHYQPKVPKALLKTQD